MGITLRGYQEDLINDLRLALRSSNRVIGCLPTGGGKTVTFSSIVRGAWEKGTKVLILTDRIELLTQAGGALKEIGLQPIKIEAGRKVSFNGSLYVAMSETLYRRMSKPGYVDWLQGIGLIIIDECHKRSFTKLMEFFNPDSKVIGFTATPTREGHKDPLAESYTDLVQGVEIEYLVKNGYLAAPNYYGVKADLSGVHMKSGDYNQDEVANRFSQAKLYRGVVQNWTKRTPGTKTLVFSSNIQNSLEIVEEFKTTGRPVRHLDSTMSATDRGSVLRWFKQTPDGILSNVGILTTGFDESSIETVVLYRATKSLSLYLQMVGRGSRTIPGVKESFSILDFGNNIATHGFWHEARTWELDLKDKKERPKGEAVLKNCPGCEAFIPAATVVCPECGYEDIKAKKEQEIAELELLNPYQLRRKADAATLEEKAELAKAGLVKAYYILHSLYSLEDVVKFVDLMGYNRFWLDTNYGRFWWGDTYLERREELLNIKTG